jgi:hypothetical protein
MPRVMVNMRLSDEERALLKKRAEKHNMGEADYLRMAMVMEALTAGDQKAWLILGDRLRSKAAESLSPLLFRNAPVKA